jgi:hypothetical protein
MGKSNLFDESDPFEDTAWKEASRRAAGYIYPRAGYVGFPEGWLEQILPLVKTRQQLAVAMLLYQHLRFDKAVPVPNYRFSALGIDRYVKYRTLAALERAGLVAIEHGTGRAVRVRLL